MTDKQQLDAELTEVLKHLPGWRLDPRYADHCWCAVLIDGTGRGIHVNATQAKGRFYLSGVWPHDGDGQQHRPDKCEHITIARNRPPEKIAAEIARRFIPWYTAAYAEQVEQAARQNAARDRQQETTAELAAILEKEMPPADSHRRHRLYARDLTVQVNHGGESVSIELSHTSVKVAKAVLRAYAKAGGSAE